MIKIKLLKKVVPATNYGAAYRSISVVDGDWQWMGNASIIPAYCGGRFLWDFQTSYEAQNCMRGLMAEMTGNDVTARDKRVLEENRGRIEEFMDLIYLALAIEFIDTIQGYQGAHETHDPAKWDFYTRDMMMSKGRMDMSFWEIQHRPMYAFGLKFGLDHLPPRRNPNSGNTASFFAGEYDMNRYLELYEKYKGEFTVEWVDSMWNDLEDLAEDEPFDEDEGYEEEEW